MKHLIIVGLALLIQTAFADRLSEEESIKLTMSPNKKWAAHLVPDPNSGGGVVKITEIINPDRSFALRRVSSWNSFMSFSWSADSKCLFFNPQYQEYYMFDVDIKSHLNNCRVDEETDVPDDDPEITSVADLVITLDNLAAFLTGSGPVEITVYDINGRVLFEFEIGSPSDLEGLDLGGVLGRHAMPANSPVFLLIKSDKTSLFRYIPKD